MNKKKKDKEIEPEPEIEPEILSKDRKKLIESFIQSGSNQDSIKDILNDLMDATDNLDLKTHINNPKEISVLKTLSTYLQEIKFEKSAMIIDNFIEFYSRYMISWKRLGRTEILRAISNYINNVENEQNDLNKSIRKKLTTNLIPA